MAVINITLSKTDTDKMIALCENDVRFAMAKTLTATAQAAQVKTRQHLRSTFVLRRTNFEKSIKVRPATKQSLTASLYTMAGFAALQQTGGKQLPKDGKLAVPNYDNLRDIKAGRKTQTPGSFLMQTSAGTQIIAKRSSTGIQVLYFLRSLTYMPKRLNMLEIGEQTAVSTIPQLFRQNLYDL